MDFMTERQIKAVRTRHLCAACDKWIEPGETASRYAGVYDGEFQTGHFHPECREAEVKLNELNDIRPPYDDWMQLSDAESDDYPWLHKEHPLAYRRMMMTRAQWAAHVATPTDEALLSGVCKGMETNG